MYLLEEHPITGLSPHFVAIFRVHSPQPLVPHWKAQLRIEAENSEHFLGPVQGLVGCAIAGPTARVGHPLRFRQVILASPHRFFCPLALGDIRTPSHELKPTVLPLCAPTYDPSFFHRSFSPQQPTLQ